MKRHVAEVSADSSRRWDQLLAASSTIIGQFLNSIFALVFEFWNLPLREVQIGSYALPKVQRLLNHIFSQFRRSNRRLFW